MDKNILVSMLIVVRNAESFIVKSIKSLVNQDFDKKNYEIIIVDGLSTDDTLIVAEKYLNENSINYKILENEQKTLASGWNSLSIGYISKSTGACSVSFGRQACACGSASTATGHLAWAHGSYTTAYGYKTCAVSDYSVAVGFNSKAWDVW